MIGLTANAQEKGPQRNDFTVAATVSYDATVMQNAHPGYYTSYAIQAQPTNWNDGRRHEHHQASGLLGRAGHTG